MTRPGLLWPCWPGPLSMIRLRGPMRSGLRRREITFRRTGGGRRLAPCNHTAPWRASRRAARLVRSYLAGYRSAGCAHTSSPAPTPVLVAPGFIHASCRKRRPTARSGACYRLRWCGPSGFCGGPSLHPVLSVHMVLVVTGGASLIHLTRSAVCCNTKRSSSFCKLRD